MNHYISERIKKIEVENKVWIIYLGIIFLSYVANSYEVDFFLNQNIMSKDSYRKINAFIFVILIIIYSYFEYDSFESLLDKSNSQKKRLDILSFLASSAVLLSGFIFLYIIIEDDDIEEEIAFN